MTSNPVLDQAYQALHDTQSHIDQAKLLVKVLSEAGADVSSQRAEIQQLELTRQKYMSVLKANGAQLPQQ